MFSGAVKIGDLNDFIAPSQACVVNLGTDKSSQQGQDVVEVGTVQLQPRATAAATRAAPAHQQPLAQPSQSAPLPPPHEEPVKISLQDCLACSGCVTSAETVLLQQQSVGELEAQLRDPGAAVVITMSPQSITSLAVYYGLTPRDTGARLAAALRSLGVAAVFDLSVSRDVALLETAAEFVHRYRLSQQGATELATAGADLQGAGGTMKGSCSQNGSCSSNGRAGSHSHGSVGHMRPAGMNASSALPAGGAEAGLTLPMLASACPGWVCYAEKTHGTFVLPYISSARSPQAVAGALVKRVWAPGAGLLVSAVPAAGAASGGLLGDGERPAAGAELRNGSAAAVEGPPAAAATEAAGTARSQQQQAQAGADGQSPAAAAAAAAAGPGAVVGTTLRRRVYHCAVMPCYDKKLEASREDFTLPGSAVPETDCVLATTEVLELLQKHGLDLPSLPTPPGPPFDALLGQAWGPQLPAEGALRGLPGGSGGYLEAVFRTAARELYGQEVPPGPLQMRVGRNADLRECTLEVNGRCVLRFAAAYGFRNIQGLMRKIRLGKCEYDYVEVMACPSGCLNGGGQLRPAKGETPQQLIERLEMAYHSQEGGLVVQQPQDSPQAHQVYEEVIKAGVGSAAAQELFHTQYHKREKSVTAALGDW